MPGINFVDASGIVRTVSAAHPLPTSGAGGGEPIDEARLVPEGGTSGQVLKVGAEGPAWGTDANTTYTAMSAAEAEAGTSTTGRTLSAKVLGDEITRRLPDIPDLPDVSGVSPIETPAEATVEDVATAFNALLAALQA